MPRYLCCLSLRDSHAVQGGWKRFGMRGESGGEEEQIVCYIYRWVTFNAGRFDCRLRRDAASPSTLTTDMSRGRFFTLVQSTSWWRKE